MESDSKIIGITGKIGAGKTYICNILCELGYPVFQSDKEVSLIYKEAKTVGKLKELVPSININNKKALRDALFNDANLLAKFEAIIHPLVNEKLYDFIDNCRGKNLIFIEAPLLFESKYNEFCNYVIIVKAEKNLRKMRVTERDKITEELFYKIDNKQLSYDEMITKSDFVIENNYNDDNTKNQLINILNKLEK